MITKQQFEEMTTRDKLLELARFLVEEVKSPWFDLNSWAEKGFPEKACGTTACAVGWATVCFPQCGLKLWRSAGAHSDSLALLYELGDETFHGIYAVRTFFGISPDEAEYLFLSYTYERRSNKRTNVAKRLKEIARRYHPRAGIK